MNFSGKKVFITGASRGIGRSIAKLFLENGAWIIGSRTKTVASYRDDLCQEWVEADFADLKQIHHCAEAVIRCKPDILINNAGININSSFAEIEVKDFQLVQQVNVLAPLILCKAAIPHMKNGGWGRIVNLSSVWGKISMTGRASYSASKFAIDGLTLAFASEYANCGILANSIAPGFINTELTQRSLGEDGIRDLISKVPMKRLGSPDEIARFVIWLASEENTFITGQNISMDGGFSRV